MLFCYPVWLEPSVVSLCYITACTTLTGCIHTGTRLHLSVCFQRGGGIPRSTCWTPVKMQRLTANKQSSHLCVAQCWGYWAVYRPRFQRAVCCSSQQTCLAGLGWTPGAWEGETERASTLQWGPPEGRSSPPKNNTAVCQASDSQSSTRLNMYVYRLHIHGQCVTALRASDTEAAFMFIGGSATF